MCTRTTQHPLDLWLMDVAALESDIEMLANTPCSLLALLVIHVQIIRYWESHLFYFAEDSPPFDGVLHWKGCPVNV